MTYQRFEDLPAWQKAAELYELTEQLLEHECFEVSRGFRDQLDRAALSVSNNIAEGFERGTTNELLQFLYIARGSAGEVRSMLVLRERKAGKRNWPADLKSQISDLKSVAENCSRQIRAWADSLQNSGIQGQRHGLFGGRRHFVLSSDGFDPLAGVRHEDEVLRQLRCLPQRSDSQESGHHSGASAVRETR